MERGSRKESWFSERNCSAIALILGNACFSTACQWWFRVWHLADVNQCRSLLQLIYTTWRYGPIFSFVCVFAKGQFFPHFSFAWKWNYRLVLSMKTNKPCCLKHWDVIVLWKVPMMSGKAVAFSLTLLFQVKVTFTQRQICSQGLESDAFYVGKMHQHEAPIYWYDLDIPKECEM